MQRRALLAALISAPFAKNVVAATLPPIVDPTWAIKTPEQILDDIKALMDSMWREQCEQAGVQPYDTGINAYADACSLKGFMPPVFPNTMFTLETTLLD